MRGEYAAALDFVDRSIDNNALEYPGVESEGGGAAAPGSSRRKRCKCWRRPIAGRTRSTCARWLRSGWRRRVRRQAQTAGCDHERPSRPRRRKLRPSISNAGLVAGRHRRAAAIGGAGQGQDEDSADGLLLSRLLRRATEAAAESVRVLRAGSEDADGVRLPIPVRGDRGAARRDERRTRAMRGLRTISATCCSTGSRPRRRGCGRLPRRSIRRFPLVHRNLAIAYGYRKSHERPTRPSRNWRPPCR